MMHLLSDSMDQKMDQLCSLINNMILGVSM